MKHKTVRGRIEYLIDSPKFPDGYWGFEEFTITRHSDGSRALRAHCELQDEDGLIRDIFQAVDKEWHPHDAFARLTKGDKFFGSTWYHFTDDEAHHEGYTAEKGRISETTPIFRGMRGFGNHSLNGDAWMAAAFDFSKGPGIQTFKNNLLTSVDHRGATGPAFERTESSSFEYHGDEEVTVPGGTFACHHMSFVNMSNDHPTYHFWVTNDGEFLFIKGTVAAPYNWSFELMNLEER
jgi:hypothetical protein